VFDGYRNGQPMLETLLAVAEPRPRIVEAMIALRESLSGKRDAQEAMNLAESALAEPGTPQLLIIMLELWVSVCSGHGRLAEVQALVRRIQELVSEDTPPELRATVCIAEGHLAGLQGDKRAREDSFRRALEAMPADAPRRRVILWERAMFLVVLVRGAEVEDDLRELERCGFPPSRLALARLCGLVEAGRAAEGLAQLPAVESDALLAESAAGRTRLYRGLAEIMLGMAPSEPERLPAALQSAQMLLARNPQEALRLARQHAAALLSAEDSAGFVRDCLVRAELAAGNAAAACRLIDERRRRGGAHFLDDLFLARAGLLTGDRPSAARRFASAVAACERHRAESRLDFELRLACELSPGDLMALTRSALTLPSEPVRADAVAPDAPGPALADPKGVGRLLGRSAAMAGLRENIRRMAPLDAAVLITGETGTGKELVARALHEESLRAGEPFLAVNCGAIAESLLESELFGHERGAFTGAHRAHRGVFEEAGRGTVLLDEIGDISPRLQVVLLRVLEAGEIRPVGSAVSRRIACRVLAATNAELDGLVARGAFRKDLLFRLKRLELRVPPLRERREDILELAGHFLAEGRSDGLRPVMTENLRRALTGRGWPGNVRELRNEMERMRLLGSEKRSYGLADLDPRPGWDAEPAPAAAKGRPLAGDASREAVRLEPSAPSAGGQGAPGAPGEDLLPSGRSAMRRRQRLGQLFERHGRLTRHEVARLLEVSGNTATADLKALCEEGLIEKVEPNSSPRTHYFAARKRP